MKIIIILFFIVLLHSCGDNTGNPNYNSGDYKVKITVYQADMRTNPDSFRLVSEIFFDGDVNNMERRMFYSYQGTQNIKCNLYQGFANVPLAYYKFGCFLKEIDYSSGDTIFAIQRSEFDNEGYLSKTIFDSYHESNKSGYGLLNRDGNKLIKNNFYKDSILNRITTYIYGANGFIAESIDSNALTNHSTKTIYYYNFKNQLDYSFKGNDTSNGTKTIYSYDAAGNNIKVESQTITNNQITDTEEYTYTIVKGYRIKSDRIDKFTFDSNDNIIGYINDDYHLKFKILYEFK